MKKAENSKRSFLKKMAAAVGFVTAAGYLRNLLPTRAESIQAINENCVRDENKQKQAWLQKQWEPMTDSDKKQMLDEIIESHDNYRA